MSISSAGVRIGSFFKTKAVRISNSVKESYWAGKARSYLKANYGSGMDLNQLTDNILETCIDTNFNIRKEAAAVYRHHFSNFPLDSFEKKTITSRLLLTIGMETAHNEKEGMAGREFPFASSVIEIMNILDLPM